jgi:hypothetical protein
LLAPGYQPAELALTDLHQQSFWIVVADGDDSTRIEAAGRSLSDMRIWHDGRDLVRIGEQRDVIAPLPSHQLTRILLQGKLPPGTYLVTIYGGPALPWFDAAADQPLYVRTGRSQDLLAGGAIGQVGRWFGSEVFAVPPDATQALLMLPKPADVGLRALNGQTYSFEVRRNQRAPATLIPVVGRAEVEVTAAPGTAFTLRGLPPVADLPGPGKKHWLAVSAPAQGGDEAPAAALLARVSRDGIGTILASPGVPSVGPTSAWRTRFNLRGSTTLLFNTAAVVTVAVQAEGPRVEPLIATLDGALINATGNGRAATRWALSPGWYVLRLDQKKPAAGILDLTLGPPGLIPPVPEPAGPPGPVLPLGVQWADTGSSLRLFTNTVPQMAGGLQVRGVPPELDNGPLVLTLPAAETQTLQVHTAHAGTLIVRDIGGGPPIERRAVAAASETGVTLPAADHARTLAVAWLRPTTPVAPAPSPPPELTALADNAPVFFDLARDQQASFALQVAQGGLFEVTTLGRLRTEGTLGTSFVPDLDRAKGNGVGANMLMQRYLRAGRYRLNVTARDSAGHLGVVSAPAPLTAGGTLLTGLSVRASLPAGTGVAFPLRIEQAGSYRLDLLGLGGPFTARLEDSGGWPLLQEGDLNGLERDFRPGNYRLIVQPPAVAARAVARLARIVPAPPIEGHGPHVLPFDDAQSATWREPVSHGAPRTPDSWTFALAGPAKITLDLTGEGMGAVLRADAPAAKPLGHVRGDGKLKQTLPAGHYVAEARAVDRNDRLDYSLTLSSEELQPGVPRTVQLPADLPFTLGERRIISLTSFGSIPLRAVLRAEDGGVLASVAERADDWNIALSRPLPAGRYRLAIAALAAPAVTANAGQSGDADQSQTADQPATQGTTEITLALAADLPDDAGEGWQRGTGGRGRAPSDPTHRRPRHVADRGGGGAGGGDTGRGSARARRRMDAHRPGPGPRAAAGDPGRRRDLARPGVVGGWRERADPARHDPRRRAGTGIGRCPLPTGTPGPTHHAVGRRTPI